VSLRRVEQQTILRRLARGLNPGINNRVDASNIVTLPLAPGITASSTGPGNGDEGLGMRVHLRIKKQRLTFPETVRGLTAFGCEQGPTKTLLH
jgi:hypothetical protein